MNWMDLNLLPGGQWMSLLDPSGSGIGKPEARLGPPGMDSDPDEKSLCGSLLRGDRLAIYTWDQIWLPCGSLGLAIRMPPTMPSTVPSVLGPA